MSKPRENSVKELANLYNVVIGIALSVAIYQSFSDGTQKLTLSFSDLPNLVIFLALVIPFYHGAVRHLFATYVEGGGSTNIKSGALLADFVLLFVEGCLFVMMAMTIDQIVPLIWVVVSLLILDSIWGFLAWLAFTGAKSQYAEKRWAFINMITSGLIVILMMMFSEFFENSENATKAAIVMAIIISIRTVVDYCLTWKFYFPEGDTVETIKP